MLTRSLRGGLPVLAVVVAVAAYVAMSRGQLVDLSVYRYGGRELLDGLPLYGGDDPVTGLPFTYPPFAAVVMVPVALVPDALAAALWTGVSVCALAGVIAMSLSPNPPMSAVASVTSRVRWQGVGAMPYLLVQRATATQPARPNGGAQQAGIGGSGLGALDRTAPGWLVALLTLGALGFEPVWQNLTFGQVNLLLMLALMAELLRPDRRWSGVLVGVAAGVKLTPLVFVVLLLMVGRRGAAGRAMLTFIVTAAVGAALMPGSAAYWGDRLLDPSRVGPPALAHNQSAYGVLTRLLDGPPPLLLWLAVAGLLTVAMLAVAARWWLLGDRLLGTCLGVLAMLVASPVSWSHHWVWAVPISIVLWTRARGVCLAWVAVFVARPFAWLPYGEGREYQWTWWEHLVGDAYFWCALGVAIWAAQAASSKSTAGLPGITVGGQSQVSSHGR